MPNFAKLSERDRAVLKSIFDPTLTVGAVHDDEDSFLDDEQFPEDQDSAPALAALPGSGAAALEQLSAAVARAPRPAAYNNRAQLLRLLGRDDEAMSDLEEALRLSAAGAGGSRVRALALCQRGALLRKRGQEAGARRDFREAAELGSAFARKQMAELNPYAALCNQMLQQVLRGEETKV